MVSVSVPGTGHWSAVNISRVFRNTSAAGPVSTLRCRRCLSNQACNALVHWSSLQGPAAVCPHVLEFGPNPEPWSHWPIHALSPGRPSRARNQRSEEHTSELQSRQYLVCRLLLEKKKMQP